MARGNESLISFPGLFSPRAMEREDLFLCTSCYKNKPFVMREVSRGWKERLRRKEAAGLDSQQGWIPNTAGTFSTCVPASSIPGFVLSLVWALINLSYSRAPLFYSFSACTYTFPSPCCSSPFPLSCSSRCPAPGASIPRDFLWGLETTRKLHSQGSSMGLGTTRQIVNHLQSVVKECPSCWWHVRRCHSAFQEKDLPLQDVFGSGLRCTSSL